jgi:hypothetical protein
MKRAEASNPINESGRNFIPANRSSNYQFDDEWEKESFLSDVRSLASIRIEQKRPEDSDKTRRQIEADVWSRIYDYWITVKKNGYIVDFPITDLI